MGAVLRSMAVAFLAAKGAEHSQLMRPWERVIAEGGDRSWSLRKQETSRRLTTLIRPIR